MECLEKYRADLLRSTNRQLRAVLAAADESAVHDFRVGIKRLNAFYRFLGEIDDGIGARRLMKPYRGLFKRLGPIRDAHIALRLIADTEEFCPRDSQPLVRALRTRIRGHYRQFADYAGRGGPTSIRLPTIRALAIPRAAILRHQPVALASLLLEAGTTGERMTAAQWHSKRILLKRYHHLVDAFALCAGQVIDERSMKQVVLLEQLLGDWHDRVVCADILAALPGPQANRKALILSLRRQGRALLESSRLYLRKLGAVRAG